MTWKTGWPWSAEDEKLVCDWYERVSTEALARKLGRTVQAVAVKARGLGVRRPDKCWPKGNDVVLVRRKASGVTQAAIAKELGCTRSAVAGRWARLKPRCGLVRAQPSLPRLKFLEGPMP